ncbi:N utilization substance protein B homolog [Striga asiatica]|uniref:N utilization substance protein B homolog n=1 Tax=Striga asiatica TaxID=4170 RepID=A0A5A7NXL6_STRAF|nr:N utilization substance protein B homolog [Striga asiatica]
MESVKVTASVRKPKKKPADRIKQAEKKKRRLEKALATSAAIRSELEKKKLKKKEEQDRLDEEGAAIAEAVALQVLLGEDVDNSEMDKGLASWDHASDIGFITGSGQPHSYYMSKNPCKTDGMITNSNRNGRMSNFWGHSNDNRVDRSFYPQYLGNIWGSVGLSAGHLAAQTISSLKISEDSRVNAFVANHFVRG